MNSRQEADIFKQWIRDVATAERDPLAPYRDRIMYLMGGVALLLLTPFTINNFLQGRHVVALILLLVQVAALVNVQAGWRGRRAPIPPALLLFPFVLGITAAVMAQGVPGILWSYPVVLYSYFALSRRMAIACSLALLAYLTWLTLHYQDFALALRLFATLLLTMIMITIVLNVISDLHHSLAKQALTDPLTGCSNRRAMQHQLETLVVRAARHPVVATLLMIDVDHFKPINDAYGHACGDLVLQRIVQVVRSRMRRGDSVFRWGGEEFLVLLEQTDANGATGVAEDIRRGIEADEILPSHDVTVSIGVSQYQAGQSVEAWTEAADAALYQAKAGGRNCVMRAAMADLAAATA